MTVEEWLRAKTDNIPIGSNILEAVLLDSIDVGLPCVSLGDDLYEVRSDEDMYRSLRYALSSLYYYASGLSGGSARTEKMGDVSVSVSEWNLDWSLRNRWWRLADKIRRELGFEPEEEQEDSGMFDATNMRLRSKKSNFHY